MAEESNKGKGAAIIALLGLLLAYLLFRKNNLNPASNSYLVQNGSPIPVPTSSTYIDSSNVKARAMGPAIKMADPTSPTGYSWTAPVGAHVEQASDGTYWAVPNTTPTQTRQGAPSLLSTQPYQPQSVPATSPDPGTTYGAGTPGVVSGTNNFPPIARGPSGSVNPNFMTTAADQEALGYAGEGTPTQIDTTPQPISTQLNGFDPSLYDTSGVNATNPGGSTFDSTDISL